MVIFHCLLQRKCRLPGALIWKGVAEALTNGLSTLHPTAQWGALIGAIVGIVLEVLNQKTKGKFPLSGVGLGLGFVLKFSDALSMALGTLIFWTASVMSKEVEHFKLSCLGQRIQETTAAGIIAGGSIIGIIIILLETAL